MATMVNREWWLVIGASKTLVRVVSQDLEQARCEVITPAGTRANVPASALYLTKEEAEARVRLVLEWDR